MGRECGDTVGPDITAAVYVQETAESVNQTLHAIYRELTAKPESVS